MINCLQKKLFFLNIDNFSNFMVESDKRSINMNDIVEYGGIEIESIRKRTQFTYAAKNGFEKILDNLNK